MLDPVTLRLPPLPPRFDEEETGEEHTDEHGETQSANDGDHASHLGSIERIIRVEVAFLRLFERSFSGSAHPGFQQVRPTKPREQEF